MDIQKVIPTNTMDAHRLIKFAASKDDPALTQRVIDRFYQVYFSDGKSIADHDVLISAATEAGLDRAEVGEVLNSDQYTRMWSMTKQKPTNPVSKEYHFS